MQARIDNISRQIVALVEIDDKINKEEIKLYGRKRVIRADLRILRKEKREILKKMGRKPGRQPSYTKKQRLEQVKTIKLMRSAGKTWREVSNVLGYRNHPECIRILKVYGCLEKVQRSKNPT